MSAIQVQGVESLYGEINVQGSKNGVLPMMAAALLHKGVTTLENVPRIQDLFCMMGILEYIGCICTLKGHCLTIDASEITESRIPETFVKSMRSSIIVLGPLAARLGEADTFYPGGCSIGKRPVDLHLMALDCLGIRTEEEEDALRARAEKPEGGRIVFPYPSVGATETAVLTAVLVPGETVIEGAAREPEISELCRMLRHMGAEVWEDGSGRISVKGGKTFKDSCFRVSGDRIVAGTYLTAVMAAGGKVLLNGVNPGHLSAPLARMEEAGAVIKREDSRIFLERTEPLRGLSLKTGPYPAFPTDLQSVFLASLVSAEGESRIQETVFEGRFHTAFELNKMGAGIIIDGDKAKIPGGRRLSGARVQAGDLRGGAALIIAGLTAEGVTVVENDRHIARGYEDIVSDFRRLGAPVSKITDSGDE